MRYLYIILFFANTIFAQNYFEKGNDFYKKDQFKEAIESYELALKSNEQSSELYFNLANAYYKINAIAPSIYNYEKALLISPNDPEILNNLKFAKNRLIDEIKETPQVGFGKLLQNFTSNFHFDTWAYLAVTMGFLLIGCFVGYYFSAFAKTKRLFFSGFTIALILMICCISAGFYEKSIFDNERPAIIFSEEIDLQNEPKLAANVVVKLHEGTKVYVIETLDNWKKVTLQDGTLGWLPSNVIKEIK